MSNLVPITRLSVGDVIMHNNKKEVIIGVKSNEGCGSCSYDREYQLCLLDVLKKQSVITLDSVEGFIYTMSIKGNDDTLVEYCDYEAPFEIRKVDCIRVRQKDKKTVIIYE